MNSLTKLLAGTALATTLTLNSYSQNIENVIVAYVSIQDKKTKTRFNVDTLKSYNVYFEAEKTDFLDFIMRGMGGKSESNESGTKIKLYLIKKTEKETLVIPTILEGGYDFSKDSKKEIEKQVREFIKEEKISISDAVNYGSGEMFMELAGE